MKILFCDNSLRSFLNFRGKVVENLSLRGFETVVVVPECGNKLKAVIKVPSYLRVVYVNMKPSGKNPLSDLNYLAILIRIYRKECPDIIFHYTIKPNTYGGFAARLLGIPAVAMVAGLGYIFNGGSIFNRLVRKLYLFGLKQAKVVLTLNEDNTHKLWSNGISHCRLLKGGEGVDLEHFYFRENRADTTTFLLVGRVLYDKGYSEFVEASRKITAEYTDVHFEILGPMAPESPMGVPEAIVQKDVSKGTVKYIGVTDDVRAFIGRDGVVVVCSSYHEGMNRSLMEGCAVGRPCIASNIPGCRELVDNGVTGFVAEPKNAESLANAMRAYMRLSVPQRQAMGIAARRKTVADFDIQYVCDEYIEIINEILDNKVNT